MTFPDLKKPKSPNFSSGPTKKPDEWSVNKLNTSFLGRYHRSNDVKKFINDVFTAKINAIAKILGSTLIFSAISIAIGVNNTAHALFEIKLVVIETSI